jgi:hypothetical protein
MVRLIKSVYMKPVAESRYKKVCLHVSCKNGLKQGDVLLPLLFKFALECVIRRVDTGGLEIR